MFTFDAQINESQKQVAEAQSKISELTKSQTLERYIEQGKTWVDSLQNQAAT